MIYTFGIRHHGPGSAKSLKKALQNLQPDLVLIEGPPDADTLIDHVANEELVPPVSLLVYNPKDFSQAAYFPFANFSPEWVAMRYALKREIPVRFMDLPQSYHYGIRQQEKENTQLAMEVPTATPLDHEEKLLRHDPMSYAAHLAGYSDSERWWEMMFEKEENPEAIFPAIIDLIRAMRTHKVEESLPRERQREAFMRQTIRKADKEGFERIAVVCGAWHSPALQDWKDYPAKQDATLLKGIKKVKTKATWVPWTFERLSRASGYNAGVISPAYYQLLFNNRKDTLTRWMSKVAKLFRAEDMDASSAHIIEAVRLADTLTALRGLNIAGIDEMTEAATSIFCEGYASRMEVIERKLIIGHKMGTVPSSIPVIPLQEDLEKAIKSARLGKERKLTEAVDKELDLRTPSNLAASHLLHRLSLLKIPWGKQKKTSRYSTGNFKEIWKLHWKPDFAILVIEAGMWGNTLYDATVNFVRNEMKSIDTLPDLTQLLELALNADLQETVEELVSHLEDLSALTKDVNHLMDALPALVNTIRYGSTRQLNTHSLEQVVDKLIPRICLALPNEVMAIDEDASKEVFERLLQVNQAINVLNQEEYRKNWYNALMKITHLARVNGLIKGACTRILFDKEVWYTDEVATQMHFSLSKGSESLDAALWLEGFLYGSGLLLIHNPVLWNILDEWVAELPMLTFQELAPLLRRTFAEFSAPERQKMMELAKRGQIKEKESDIRMSINTEQATKVVSTVQLLLGVKP